MRILHISDIHVGANVSQSFAEMVIRAINNSTKADLIWCLILWLLQATLQAKAYLASLTRLKMKC